MENDLNDIREDTIVIPLDNKSLTAIQTELGKWSAAEKQKTSIIGNQLFLAPDPSGELDVKRKALISAVDKNADSMTSMVRMRFNGVKFSFIIGQLNEPAEVNP